MSAGDKTSRDLKNVDIFETVDKLAIGLRSLEEWYAVDFRRRVMELTEVLQGEIANSLGAELNAGFQQKIEKVRTEYEERLQAHLSQWQSERGLLQQDIEQLKRQVPNRAIVDEIARVEAALQKCASETERSIADDSVVLGRLLQMRTEELELKAYFKGLNYCFALMNTPADAIKSSQADTGNRSDDPGGNTVATTS